MVPGAVSLRRIPAARRYTGWSKHGEDYVEPHVVGEDGYGYLRLYEMTGKHEVSDRGDSLRRCAGEELQARRRNALALARSLLRARRQREGRQRNVSLLRKRGRADHAV